MMEDQDLKIRPRVTVMTMRDSSYVNPYALDDAQYLGHTISDRGSAKLFREIMSACACEYHEAVSRENDSMWSFPGTPG